MRMQSDPATDRARRMFWALWAVVFVVKAIVATRLPLFVDEAFYWQEGQHPAAAYSDLPGLTAWLARLGVELGGNNTLALRAPFLVLAALVPWLVMRLTRRAFGEREGWIAGAFAVLLPLSGSLGLLAVPDPLLALATLLCLDAGSRLLRGVAAAPALELAVGLTVGALSHYRFIAVIGVGFVALLALSEGRRALRDPRVIIAILVGAAAWAPLVAWNYDHADAGLRFQLVDRHPWAFHADGLWFIAIQALLATPLLFVALLAAGRDGLRSPLVSARYFAWLGLLLVGGFFLLGFFADTERVSFHWPLPGLLALLPLLPRLLEGWSRSLRAATAVIAGVGLASVLGYYVAVSAPSLREQVAAEKWYPANFAGWDELADAVRAELASMPPGSEVLADNFKVGSELGFALGNPRIPVLDHPLTHKHGRAPQLRLWGLHRERLESDRPVLLVVGASQVEFKNLHRHYLDLCERVGPLPPARVLNVDHGRQRLALFRLEGRREGACTAPSMAWLDTPVSGVRVARSFPVRGWAFRQGVGIAKVEATIDGRVVSMLEYGLPYEGLETSWPGLVDPNMPNLGFAGTVDTSGLSPGRHWLGLRLHGRDGHVEAWPEIPVQVPGGR